MVCRCAPMFDFASVPVVGATTECKIENVAKFKIFFQSSQVTQSIHMKLACKHR